MLQFDVENPFPLLPADSHSYAEAQDHSAAVDHWLGMDTEGTERRIARLEGQELWAHLPIRSMLTPYTEIRLLLDQLAPPSGSTLVDLGAGYGRFAFVIARHYPGVRFVGYELASERVELARQALRHQDLSETQLVCADLNDPAFAPEAAEFYFLYDFGTRAAIEKSLQDLRRVAQERAITVVGRGRASRDAIERQHPWLSQVHPPEHFPHYSIYRS